MKKVEIEKNLETLNPEESIRFLNELQERGIRVDSFMQRVLKKMERMEKESARYNHMLAYEREAMQQGASLIAGVDEAGRGPLAGAVVAAAVILSEEKPILGVNDSKQLSEKCREELFDVIVESSVAFAVGIVDEKTIDSINILNAAKKAMSQAILSLVPAPDHLLLDAVRLENIKLPQHAIIKGDTLSASIAAASIIAKVTRDRMMLEADKLYPAYGFAKHKGYGTKDHMEAIKKFGLCPIHRISFTKNL